MFSKWDHFHFIEFSNKHYSWVAHMDILVSSLGRKQPIPQNVVSLYLSLYMCIYTYILF